MDHIYSNTNNEKRKRGTHLNFEDRVTIKVLKQQGFSNRAIAKQLNCSPSTVGYELKRGTADYGGRGRKPSYSAKRGQAAIMSRIIYTLVCLAAVWCISLMFRNTTMLED